jgi:hypothetical protein
MDNLCLYFYYMSDIFYFCGANFGANKYFSNGKSNSKFIP